MLRSQFHDRLRILLHDLPITTEEANVAELAAVELLREQVGEEEYRGGEEEDPGEQDVDVHTGEDDSDMP